MEVVTFAARKGGVGKTLLTASMAVLAGHRCEMEHMRYGTAPTSPEVFVIDLDPQGCLTNWWNRRAGTVPAIAEIAPAALEVGLDGLAAGGARYVFIDTPPGHSEIVTVAKRQADLVVIPVKPSELDLAATIKTVTAAERMQARYRLLPNGANFRSRAMGEAIRFLRDAGLPLLPPVHNRVGLMLQRGRTLSETDAASSGAHELGRVWLGIEAALREQHHDQL